MRSLINLGLTLGYSVKLSPTKSPHFKSLQTQIIEIIVAKKTKRVCVLKFQTEHLAVFEQGDLTCKMLRNGRRYL